MTVDDRSDRDLGAVRSGTMRAATDTIDTAVEEARSVGRPIEGAADLDALADRIADSRYVLLGEASHGTAEFYQFRARLTARLIERHGFSFVAVEGDWTDCYEVNRYVKGLADATTRETLETFERWPTWMWANWEVLEFLEWLAAYNDDRQEGGMAGFYGLDVYSLFESMRALIDYLEGVDDEAAEEARAAYRCFEPYGDDAKEYARSIRLAPDSCEDEVVELLARLRRDRPDHDDDHRDERFNAEQNALVARNAEEYYRSMIGPGSDSWNVRDRHMVETLDRLYDHHGPDSKAVVWAHNTHVGDARATDMERRGRLNLGQLARERQGRDEVSIVGFGTHHGSVIAGTAWEAPMEEMTVPPAQDGSYGDVFHRAEGRDRFVLTDDLDAESPLADPRGHRAIGVVYDPDRETGNYVPTVLPDRYDAFVHVEATEALHPISMHADRGALPELFPWGL